MYYGKLNKADIANGPGVRVSLFVSGCDLKCKGCFNREAWDFEYGEPFTSALIAEILDALEPDYISGLTILGGEPLHKANYNEVKRICRRVKQYFPDKTIWLYTGKTFENVGYWAIFDYVDVVVDGPFIESQKDITLKFRGSRNQRIIDVQESIKLGTVILHTVER